MLAASFVICMFGNGQPSNILQSTNKGFHNFTVSNASSLTAKEQTRKQRLKHGKTKSLLQKPQNYMHRAYAILVRPRETQTQALTPCVCICT